MHYITDVNEAQHTKTISLAPIDFGQMENWLFAIESTRHTVTLPMPLAIDFAHLTSQKLDVLNDSSVLEFFKLFYKRIVKFTSFIGVFSSLSANDRKVSSDFYQNIKSIFIWSFNTQIHIPKTKTKQNPKNNIFEF